MNEKTVALLKEIARYIEEDMQGFNYEQPNRQAYATFGKAPQGKYIMRDEVARMIKSYASTIEGKILEIRKSQAQK